MQFKYAMQQILLRNNIRNSQSANCMELNNDPTGAIFDILWKQKKEKNMFMINTDIELLHNDEEEELPEQQFITLRKNI